MTDRAPPDDPAKAAAHRKNLLKLIEGASYRHDRWQVFSDFVEFSAIAISNAVDHVQRGTRETRYMEAIKRYTAEELNEFPKMLAELTLALDAEPHDCLGHVFHDLELHNKYTGQFFTPYEVCRMMAKMNVGDEMRALIADRGFTLASEPACGSGAMVIALAEAMRDQGINYQQHLHVTAVDVDPKCVHMAYLQLSLLHVPAVVIHGNSLSLEEHAHWLTPAHIMGGWWWKLRKQPERAPEPRAVVSAPPPADEPQPRPSPAVKEQLSLF